MEIVQIKDDLSYTQEENWGQDPVALHHPHRRNKPSLIEVRITAHKTAVKQWMRWNNYKSNDSPTAIRYTLKEIISVS